MAVRKVKSLYDGVASDIPVVFCQPRRGKQLTDRCQGAVRECFLRFTDEFEPNFELGMILSSFLLDFQSFIRFKAAIAIILPPLIYRSDLPISKKIYFFKVNPLTTSWN